jgi:hypothetical protein
VAQKLFFAWVDETEDFDPDVHARVDENVFSITLSQVEGDFAAAECVIKNPRIGLLNTGRKQWAYISFLDGTDITPIIKGRLVGIPSNVFDTLVTINFVARPSNFDAQKLALAETLKVLPYWDPIFISPDSWDDPDTVLEARSVLWHIDPVTHVVTVSDILIPEDGTVEVGEGDHLYADMSVTLDQTPLRQVAMTATIPWTQSDQSAASLKLARRIKLAFGTDYNGLITSYTLGGLADDWPKQGDDFANGWSVVSGSLEDVSYALPVVPIPDVFSWQGTIPRLAEGSIVFPLKVTGEYHSGEKAGFNFQFELVVVQLGWGVPTLDVAYTASREFAQVVTFTLETDQQAIITLPGDDEALAITLNANKVSDVSYNGDIPIGDVRKRTYVHSERGEQSLEYLLLVARAHLIARSRAVSTTFKQGWIKGMACRSLRKASLLHDHRLPGGQAVGKITSYKFTIDGSTGEARAEITIASCIGYGGSYTGSSGTPTYVDEGWVDMGWQEYENAVTVLDTEDIQWTIPTFTSYDDGLDFEKGLNDINAVTNVTVVNPAGAQEAALNAASDGPNTDQAKVSSVLQNVATQVSVTMVPMEGGPFQQEVVLSVSDLVVPKQIDLEAPSNA